MRVSHIKRLRSQLDRAQRSEKRARDRYNAHHRVYLDAKERAEFMLREALRRMAKVTAAKRRLHKALLENHAADPNTTSPRCSVCNAPLDTSWKYCHPCGSPWGFKDGIARATGAPRS